MHKKVNYLLQHVQANWLRVPLSRLLKGNDVEPRPSSAERQSPLMSSGAYGLRALVLDDRTVPEADAGRIAALAREDVDRLNFFLSFLIFLVLGIVLLLDDLSTCFVLIGVSLFTSFVETIF